MKILKNIDIRITFHTNHENSDVIFHYTFQRITTWQKQVSQLLFIETQVRTGISGAGATRTLRCDGAVGTQGQGLVTYKDHTWQTSV